VSLDRDVDRVDGVISLAKERVPAAVALQTREEFQTPDVAGSRSITCNKHRSRHARGRSTVVVPPKFAMRSFRAYRVLDPVAMASEVSLLVVNLANAFLRIRDRIAFFFQFGWHEYPRWPGIYKMGIGKEILVDRYPFVLAKTAGT
jgi:hypothetical protein